MALSLFGKISRVHAAVVKNELLGHPGIRSEISGALTGKPCFHGAQHPNIQRKGFQPVTAIQKDTFRYFRSHAVDLLQHLPGFGQG